VFFDTLCVFLSPLFFLNFLFLKLQFMRIKMYIKRGLRWEGFAEKGGYSVEWKSDGHDFVSTCGRGRRQPDARPLFLASSIACRLFSSGELIMSSSRRISRRSERYTARRRRAGCGRCAALRDDAIVPHHYAMTRAAKFSRREGRAADAQLELAVSTRATLCQHASGAARQGGSFPLWVCGKIGRQLIC